MKKKAAVGPIEGLTWEGLVSAPVALGFIAWVTIAGDSTAWNHGSGHVLLLMLTGVVTAVPLLCFAGAANPRDPTLLHELTQILAVKFDTTLVALSLAAILVLAQHLIQRYEEAALNKAGQYCIDNLINRLLNE